MNCAIYARVSTEDQDCQIQLEDLCGRARREGWDATVLTEKQSTRKQRPILEQLLKDAGQRKYDVILVWKLDRFGRTFQELVDNIAAVDRVGVRFICTTQGIDTDQRNPVSRLTIHILAAVAEFERDLRKERCDAGLVAYQTAWRSGQIGKTKFSRSGKNLAIGRPRVVLNKSKARALRENGLSLREIGKKLGCSYATVSRVLKA